MNTGRHLKARGGRDEGTHRHHPILTSSLRRAPSTVFPARSRGKALTQAPGESAWCRLTHELEVAWVSLSPWGDGTLALLRLDGGAEASLTRKAMLSLTTPRHRRSHRCFIGLFCLDQASCYWGVGKLAPSFCECSHFLLGAHSCFLGVKAPHSPSMLGHS